jgi:hypothetical protein
MAARPPDRPGVLTAAAGPIPYRPLGPKAPGEFGRGRGTSPADGPAPRAGSAGRRGNPPGSTQQIPGPAGHNPPAADPGDPIFVPGRRRNRLAGSAAVAMIVELLFYEWACFKPQLVLKQPLVSVHTAGARTTFAALRTDFTFSQPLDCENTFFKEICP